MAKSKQYFKADADRRSVSARINRKREKREWFNNQEEEMLFEATPVWVPRLTWDEYERMGS